MSVWDVNSKFANVAVCLREKKKDVRRFFEKVSFGGTVGDNKVVASFQ